MNDMYIEIKNRILQFFKKDKKNESNDTLENTGDTQSKGEMSLLFEILSRINEKEILEARAHKNKIKGSHVFDILEERGKIGYIEIFYAIEELYGNIKSKNLIFLKNGAGISFKNEKTYLSIDGEEKEVKLTFFPKKKDIINAKIPIVVLPRNEYDVTLSLVARHTSFRGKGGTKFTFENVVEDAIRKNVSDIHVTYSDEYAYVSYRIDGDLIPQPDYLLSLDEGMLFLRKIKQEATAFTKGKFHADEHELPQSARIEYPRLKVDIRLQFTPKGTRKGVNSLTARLLLQQTISAEDFSFSDMGYDEDFINIINIGKRMKAGLILVTGITGSGKSTVLSHFALLFSSLKRIITFEDPIEYKMSGSHITQHQESDLSDDRISFTFSDGIRSSKRSDPDVIYIGEIRKNKENTDLIDSVVESAKAGQTVLSTVHVDSVFDLYRSMNVVFGVDKDTISDLLLLSISQVLVKKLCPHCKIEDRDDENKKELEEALKNGRIKYYYKDTLTDFLKDENVKTFICNREGCEHCAGGVVGRMPIYEYLKPDVNFMMWLSKGEHNRFEVEKEALKDKDRNICKTKLETYIEALRRGDVDATPDTIDRVF